MLGETRSRTPKSPALQRLKFLHLPLMPTRPTPMWQSKWHLDLAFPTRRNTPPVQMAGQRIERHGAEVTVQEGRARAFDGTILNMKNIVGTFHPESRDRILLFAHWDTRPFADKDTVRLREPIDGANDGASGVGVLLEIARQLGLEAADVGVDIVFFDAEDYGRPEWLPAMEDGYKTWCLGSQFWAENPHRHRLSGTLRHLARHGGCRRRRVSSGRHECSLRPARRAQDLEARGGFGIWRSLLPPPRLQRWTTTSSSPNWRAFPAPTLWTTAPRSGPWATDPSTTPMPTTWM